MKKNLFFLFGNLIVFFIQLWARSWENYRRLSEGLGNVSPNILTQSVIETGLLVISGVLLTYLLSFDQKNNIGKTSLLLKIILFGLFPFIGLLIKYSLILKIFVLPLKYLPLIEWSLTPIPPIWLGFIVGWVFRQLIISTGQKLNSNVVPLEK